MESALQGQNPTVLARLPESFAAIGDVHWLPGYSVLLTDDPTITQLSDLPRTRRLAYLESIDHLATAVEHARRHADSKFRRVNIEILGNTDAFLHTHIWPRYEWEPDHRHMPVWLYPPDHWTNPTHALNAAHNPLRAAITNALETTPPGRVI